MAGLPPTPPGGFTIYDSYATDPKFQRYLTWGWVGAFGIAFATIGAPGFTRWVGGKRWRLEGREGGGTWGLGLMEWWEVVDPRKGDEPAGRRMKQSDRNSGSGSEPGSFIEESKEKRDDGNLERGLSYDSTAKPPRAGLPPRKSWAIFSFLTYVYYLLALPTIPIPRFLTPTWLGFSRRCGPTCACKVSSIKCRCPHTVWAPLTLGETILLLIIPLLVLINVLPKSQLSDNPNRLGFIAVSLLPPLFLLAGKDSAFTLLLGLPYTKLNLLHRWIGRAMLVLAIAHGSIWLSHPGFSLSSPDEGPKVRRGIVTLSFLALLNVSSIPIVRKWSYTLFFCCHVLGFVGVLAAVNTHTTYAYKWTGWGVVLPYGIDLTVRTFARYRFALARVEALDGGLTLIRVPEINAGWKPGQHVVARLFISHETDDDVQSKWGLGALRKTFRPLQGHPFTLASATEAITVLPSKIIGENDTTNSGSIEGGGVSLCARSLGKGTWTGDLWHAVRESQLIDARTEASKSNFSSTVPTRPITIHCLLEGPYGGLNSFTGSLDTEETVLLVAGGSGMTFVLGVLDDLVGRTVKGVAGGTRTKVVEVVWVIKERAAIAWFSSALDSLVRTAERSSLLTVNVRIHVTCDPSISSNSHLPLDSTSPQNNGNNDLATPPPSIQNCSIVFNRPALPSILAEVIKGSVHPCVACKDVCRCGDSDGLQGICPDSEGECCGSAKPGESAVDLESRGDEDGNKPNDIQEAQNDNGGGQPNCCANTDSRPRNAGSCCGGGQTTLASSDSKAPCCGGNPTSTTLIQSKHGKGVPREIRTGGLGVAVCGPPGMTAEMRNAVAGVALRDATRIGGITLHSEFFSI